VSKIKIGIVGITGYTGEELLKILAKHKSVEISALASRSIADTRLLKDIYPHFEKLGLTCEKLDIGAMSRKVDVVFLALPHRVSFEVIPDFLKQGRKVIDLSADFRLNEAHVYETWYGAKHTATEFLDKAVYGLPEMYRDKIKTAGLVANPGCYPTSALLGLLPAIKKDAIDLSSIIIDAKSGISGAGRKSSMEYFEKEHPNFRPYNIGGAHRHTPEIEQELSKAAGKNIVVTFTPQIIPVERGMASTIYSTLKTPLKTPEILGVYKEFYKHEPFVRVLDEGKIPDVKSVVETNYCNIGVKVDERTNRLIVITTIDNLVKGASGQAVQNMNIMCGFDEKEGLK
jgi:N-acetyl-gamma-glutamyl-phosphate reductase